MEDRLLNYLVELYGVYIHLKDDNYENTISKQLFFEIIDTGKYIHKKEKELLEKIQETVFLLKLIEKLSLNKKMGNYQVDNLDKVIKEGEKICSDLEK